MGETYGQRVRAARLARGMQARELARRVGITPSWLSHIEHNRMMPGVHVTARIAEVLGVGDLGPPCNRQACAALRREVLELRAAVEALGTSKRQ